VGRKPEKKKKGFNVPSKGHHSAIGPKDRKGEKGLRTRRKGGGDRFARIENRRGRPPYNEGVGNFEFRKTEPGRPSECAR